MISVRIKKWITALLFLAAACIGGPGRQAEGQLRWDYPPKKAPMRVRRVRRCPGGLRIRARPDRSPADVRDRGPHSSRPGRDYRGRG